ncbi:MAG: UDP-2,4-diacetamido-2,4,6-trideoxy-beta-L-altropyranose hydrolase [Clostridium sp.]|nr:UDP-2,4-diacetamido-2,4,6-trideoxy-beta-L-altropyranose hydrolase [Clostridium sp.]MCM1458776.1 UDP-2,4-diacetamido-2,4,6-trideoxy-beta-L-altropyranose hydrolase [Bacteroides sp.]
MIGFRLDANEQIATGHMMRCIAIAKQCQLLGEDCIFLLAEEKNTDFLEENHLMYHVLNVDWQDWDASIPKVADAIDKFQIHCLVVDSYQVTHKFFNELYNKTKLFYMDDMCKERFSVHMALHYSQWGEEKIIEDLYANTETVTYSGLQYVPLREEFLQKGNQTAKKQILVTTGGTDPLHFTMKLCRQILQETALNQYDVCAILGKMNCDKEAMDILARENKRLKVYQNIRNMCDRMRESTISVSAGGSTVYELFSCGVPVVCFGFSDDQVGMGERMEKAGMVIWAGDARTDITNVVNRVIEGLKQYVACDMGELSLKLQSLVDGKGCERIAGILRESIYDII